MMIITIRFDMVIGIITDNNMEHSDYNDDSCGVATNTDDDDANIYEDDDNEHSNQNDDGSNEDDDDN